MTELKLEFELENAELPIDYDKVILSFMKAAIENFYNEYNLMDAKIVSTSGSL